MGLIFRYVHLAKILQSLLLPATGDQELKCESVGNILKTNCNIQQAHGPGLIHSTTESIQKMLGVTNHHGNSNQNYDSISPPANGYCQTWFSITAGQ